MRIETLATQMVRARKTNTVTATFPTLVPQKAYTAGTRASNAPSGTGNATANTTRGIIDLAGNEGKSNGVSVPNRIKAMFYGVGTDTQTILARFYAWHLLMEETLETAMWIPSLLCEILATLTSTQPGVAGCLIGATELFADTITITYGNSLTSVEAVSPANDLPAHIILDVKGAQILEPVLCIGTATSANALISQY